MVPEHRGHRYGGDLVAEALDRFSDAGAVEANDGTDAGNAPMAAALARSGYRVIGRCVIMR